MPKKLIGGALYEVGGNILGRTYPRPINSKKADMRGFLLLGQKWLYKGEFREGVLGLLLLYGGKFGRLAWVGAG